MFVGLMVDGERINVLEYNVRFGDPECEPLMMRFEGDLAETLLACAEGRLKDSSIRLSPRAAVSVVLASGGYPGEYRKGVAISGLERIDGSRTIGGEGAMGDGEDPGQGFPCGNCDRTKDGWCPTAAGCWW